MNTSVKKFIGAGLTSVLAAISLGAQTAMPFGNLPLWFENSGAEKFIAHGSGSEFAVSAGGTEFTLEKTGGEMARCTLQFAGANPSPQIFGDQPLAGRINHFIGNRPGAWHTGAPTFARVRVENVYPGVNVVYYGNQETLEYDFNLAAGVSPSVISLHFAGAEKISLDPEGALVIKVNAGEIVQHAPVAYQMIGGTRQEVAAGYKILDAHTAAFALDNYDHAQPLVIDPVLSYSTYYGGNLGQAAWAIAVNATDNSIYVAGQTVSTKSTNGIPWTTNSFQMTNNGGRYTGDAFVAKFDATGTNLLYATYLGGSGNDGALSLAVDGAGNAYVAGYTDSTNFPTQNALYSRINSLKDPHYKTPTYAVDAFVTELNPDGSALVYSTYLGGNSMDAAYGITLDPAGNAYVTGYTYSTNFPVTPGAFQTTLQCSNTVYINANAFLTVLAAGGSSLEYSTYLGGTNHDIGRAVAYNNNKVFVAGYTYSTNFPCTNFLSQFRFLNGDPRTNKNKKLNGASDAFVTAFDATTPGNLSVLYSTYLGGTNNDVANSIAADTAGNAYVAGYTVSTNFPYINGLGTNSLSFVHTNIGNRYELATNGFLTKITWDGTNTGIGYSVMFGRKGVNVANGVALDADNNAYVVGSASCTNFPTTNTSGYLSATNSSRKKRNWSDAFIIVFTNDCSSVIYSAYLGGYDNDFGNAIAVDAEDNAYIAGETYSTNFPTVDPYQPHRSGTNSMFIAMISPSDPPVPLLGIALDNSSSTAHANVAGAPPAARPIVLKWKKLPVNYELESCTDMARTNWQAVPQAFVYTNGCYQVSLPATNGIQFFRLHRQ